jgi:protein-arginine kinase activator protein McsA
MAICDRCETEKATVNVMDYYRVRHLECDDCAKRTMHERLTEQKYDLEHNYSFYPAGED